MSVIALIAAVTLTGLYISSGRPLWNGPVSDHFDGTYFYNKEPDHSFLDMVKWMWQMETVDWPEWIEDGRQPAPPAYVDGEQLNVTYINQATVLIQTDSLNILTDPIWSQRAGPISWLGVKRVRAPGVRFEDLPKIDIILISHDHYDHLDLPSLRKLAERDRPLILVGLGTRQLLNSESIENVIEMDWWDEYASEGQDIKITFVPSRHNSGRSMFGNNRRLWGGFVIESPGGRIYFAGDTAYDKILQAIGERFDSFRLTILPLGSYEKRWFMKSQHINPEEAILIHKMLNSGQSIGIHFGTFAEHPEQAIDAHVIDLKNALIKHDLGSSKFLLLEFGQGILISDAITFR